MMRVWRHLSCIYLTPVTYIVNIHGTHSYWKQGTLGAASVRDGLQLGLSVRRIVGRGILCRHVHSLLWTHWLYAEPILHDLSVLAIRMTTQINSWLTKIIIYSWEKFDSYVKVRGLGLGLGVGSVSVPSCV